METTQMGSTTLERRTLQVGFVIVGTAIAVTTVSYALNMIFSPQWLVWVVAAAFAAVAFLALEWPRALRHDDTPPEGRARKFLLLSIPLAFVVSSQVCGLGARACNGICHATNLSLVVLGAMTAIRLHRQQSVAPFLISMVVLSLVPHCVCHAPINSLWHRALAGFAPTCEMIPLAVTLFSLSALRGARWHRSTTLVIALLGIMIFVIVGGSLLGFPWRGCVDHPAAV